jgi:hypothetical protein
MRIDLTPPPPTLLGRFSPWPRAVDWDEDLFGSGGASQPSNWAYAVAQRGHSPCPAACGAEGDCAFCKVTLFRVMERFACDHAFRHCAFDEIVDDWSGHRPGARTAAEFGVVALIS